MILFKIFVSLSRLILNPKCPNIPKSKNIPGDKNVQIPSYCLLLRILEVDTNVGLEIKYAVIFSSHILVYVKNAMEILYKSLFYDVLVPIQCISVSWTLATHNLFKTPSRYLKSLKMIIKEPMMKGLLYWFRGFWCWKHLCWLTV